MTTLPSFKDRLLNLRNEFENTYPNHNFDQLYMDKINSHKSVIENGDVKNGDSLFNLSAHPYLMALMLIIALEKEKTLAAELKEAFETEARKPRSGDNKEFSPDFDQIYKNMNDALHGADLPTEEPMVNVA